jgi:transglutaminase/protease-like cytokinesis protein 3
MKKTASLILAFGLALLIACSASPAPADAGSTSAVSGAAGSEPAEMENDPEAQAEQYAGPMIEAALSALAESPRDDLSTVTFPFDAANSYSGPTDEETQLYGSSDNSDLDEENTPLLNAICDLVIENMPQEASAYDKYRYLAYFLSEATDYDTRGTGGIMSITPYGAIVEGRSICLGYATAYLYLCEKADLWCSVVYGYSENGVHGWDLVKLEDGTYYVDVTWCDGLGRIGTDDWQQYFMLTEDVLLRDHGILSGGPATGATIFN